MLLNLKKLNESLEKNYTLDEAFDDSMPKWLRDRIAVTNVEGRQSEVSYRTYGGTKNRGTGSSIDLSHKYPLGQVPWVDYQANRKEGESDYDLGLGPQLLKHGIDLSKVKIIEAPVPDKVPRSTKNQQIIPIFHLTNGQVWAKGINDREKYADGNAPYGVYDQTFGALGNKLIPYCDAYAYIELSDPAVGTVAELREKRKELLREVEQLPNYIRQDKNAVARGYAYVSGRGRVKVDKSGYYTEVNQRKYKDAVKRLRASNVGKNIITYTEQLEDYKEVISSILLDIDFSDNTDDDIGNRLQSLQNAVQYLKNAYGELYDIIDTVDTTDYKNDSFYLDRIGNKASNLKDYLEYLQDSVGKYEKAVADW